MPPTVAARARGVLGVPGADGAESSAERPASSSSTSTLARLDFLETPTLFLGSCSDCSDFVSVGTPVVLL